MQAIIAQRPGRNRPYAWGSITVNPNSPHVGEVTTIGFPLKNPDPDEVVVERIEVKVALFGIGLEWEELGVLGPIHLPPHSGIKEATISWTPMVGGHRCVRATIHLAGARQPLVIGRNLEVIEARADQDSWITPFRLGNPEGEPAPIELHLGGNEMPAIAGGVRIGGRDVLLDRPLWLRPGEVVEAALVLRAQTEAALDHVRTLEATIHGRLIDGIEVVVRRPSRLSEHDRPGTTSELAVTAREPTFSVVA